MQDIAKHIIGDYTAQVQAKRSEYAREEQGRIFYLVDTIEEALRELHLHTGEDFSDTQRQLAFIAEHAEKMNKPIAKTTEAQEVF